MHKCIWIIIAVALLIVGGQPLRCDAEVIIKVRALNPLETTETAVIHYPLPKKISQEDIFNKKITYSMDHSEDDEPPKSDFKISLNEEEGGYYIDDSLVLKAKEIVTLEVHVKDIWMVDKGQIEDLRGDVEGLLADWELESKNGIEGELEPQAADEELSEEELKDKQNEEETKELSLMMKEEILKGLEKIIKRQDENTIIGVGVERHIEAYEDNMEEFRQIQQDIILLANLMAIDSVEGDSNNVETDDEGEESIEEDQSEEDSVEVVDEIETIAEVMVDD